jgi:hypothetical protein
MQLLSTLKIKTGFDKKEEVILKRTNAVVVTVMISGVIESGV